MGKVVKYCASCEESFAEKFSFCPNCAAGLTAYEMNPIAAEPPTPEPIKVFEPTPPVEKIEMPPPFVEKVEEPTAAFKTVSFEKEPEPTAPVFLNQPSDDILELKKDDILELREEVTEEFSASTPMPTVPAVAAHTFEDYQQTYQVSSDHSPSASTEDYSRFEPMVEAKKVDDDGYYHVTFVQPKGEKTRNALLLGAATLILFGSFFFTVYSLMNHDAYIAAIDDISGNPIFAEAVAEEEEEEEEPKNKDKDDGGGGGGGKNEPIETSKGRIATQVENPITPPSARIPQIENPELPIEQATQGNKKAPLTEERTGNPNSKNFDILSDGQGGGGGQGSGQGTGQGTGRGTGQGSGIGSGSGGGIGSGNGGGSGRGSGDPDDGDRNGGGPPQIKVGPTEGIKILSKPRPPYTDAARSNQVSGTVTLRVTFLANGSIGSISTISGLPHGLTEQAIAAARNIRFEPAKKNGVPYAVTKSVQFNFTLY
jgi:TonB family protein